jgi:hypothetical protein
VPRVERGEERQAEHPLDLGQRLRDRRLRDRQELRDPADVPELVERNQQLQMAQLQVGAQHAVDLGHRMDNLSVMKPVDKTIGL